MTDSPSFKPAQLLCATHDVAAFDSGEPTLDNWLKRHALKNNELGATRTYVSLSGERIAGFVSMTVGELHHSSAIGSMRRNMPDPIPVTVLARLAVDRHYQGYSLGRSLVHEALVRSLQAANQVGIRGMIVHALDERVRGFYENLGFKRSRIDDLTLMTPFTGLNHLLQDEDKA